MNTNNIIDVFLNFFKPYFSYIDKGKIFRNPFKWLYTLIAILNLLIPFYLIYEIVDSGIFRYNPEAKYVILVILLWLVIAFVSWLSFQLWWDRRLKISSSSSENDDFVVTPVFSHLIQTLGEWIGTWFAIVGFSIALFATLFLGENGYYFVRMLDIPFLGVGFFSIIVMPIYGFLIIVITRFIAEQFRALVSIANNTKKSEKTVVKPEEEPVEETVEETVEKPTSTSIGDSTWVE